MTTNGYTSLQELLRLGLTVVHEDQLYKAKNWVTSVHAADIDNDGDIEILVGSRDGRVQVVTKEGDRRWSRIPGDKAWISRAIALPASATHYTPARVIASTRDGKLYAFSKDGQTVDKDGSLYPLRNEKQENQSDDEKKAYWFRAEQIIRDIAITPEEYPAIPKIIAGSEDRNVYALSSQTGELLWTFSTEEWVRTVFACDLNHDKTIKILAGSTDNYLYLLTSDGECVAKYDMSAPIRSIFAADINGDGQLEVLVGTDAKDLIVLNCHLEILWRKTLFENYMLSMYVTDLDRDGKPEIIVGSEDKHLYFLNSEGKLLWRYNLGHRIFSIYAQDIDHDDVIEIIVGSEGEKIHILRVNLDKNLMQRILSSYRSQKRNQKQLLLSSITSMKPEERALLQDITQEPGKPAATMQQGETLLKDGHFKEALEAFLALRHQKVQTLWHKEMTSYVRTLCFGDVAGDGKPKLIIGTADKRLHVYNSMKGKEISQCILPGQISAIQAGHLLHHKQEEVIACSTHRSIYIVGSTKSKQNEKEAQLKQLISHNIDERLSSVSVKSLYHDVKIVLGSENQKIYIYDGGLEHEPYVIHTDQGIKVVHIEVNSGNPQAPEIIAGSLDYHVYAYRRPNPKPLWKYHTWDRIRAISTKDINGDGINEIIIGCEDRNIHVLDSNGHLLWRYYLPHSVLTTDIADVDQDDKYEILVGCADGYLYVFDRDGNLLWKHKERERVHTLHCRDINDDGIVEIATASEKGIELLQIIAPQYSNTKIETCWKALICNTSPQQLIYELLSGPSPVLRAFALEKLATNNYFQLETFEQLIPLVKDESIIVRIALIQTIMSNYKIYPQKIRDLLRRLSTDPEREVRLAFIEHIPQLLLQEPELAFQYVTSFAGNADRFVRRAVIRTLYQLIDSTHNNRHATIFELLLDALCDKDSEWICQEAARAIAHLLDRNPSETFAYLYQLIMKGTKHAILEQLTYYIGNPAIRDVLAAIVPLLSIDTDTDTLDKIAAPIELVQQALEKTRGFLYGNDTLLIYTELHRLFSLQTIEDIVSYHCLLTEDDAEPDNQHFTCVLHILQRMASLIRILKIYLKRKSLNDRASSLLEAIRIIDVLTHLVTKEYQTVFHGNTISKLPDRKLFRLLLKRWHETIQSTLNELRGNAKLTVELLTQSISYEKRMGILLKISNVGSSPAYNVRVALLHNNDFRIIGHNTFETEIVFWQEDTQAEFTISTQTYVPSLSLSIEVVYDDAETIKRETFTVPLVLERTKLLPEQHFLYIPNPYSTGTPMHESSMVYGRDEDIQRLKKELTLHKAQTVIVLYGQRRTGKTTLLLYLANNGNLKTHIPIFIDLQRIVYHLTVSSFFFKVADSIHSTVTKRGFALAYPDEQAFERDATFAFDRFLDRVEEQLHETKLILLIDEFETLEQEVTQGRLDAALYHYLRSLIQSRPRVNFLLSGTHRLEQMTQDYQSIFFNIAAHYPLSRLTKEGAIDLIQQPVVDYLTYEPYALEKLRLLTGNHPYLINLMCRSLVDHCNEYRKVYVTINDINMIMHSAMQTGNGYFAWLWSQTPPEEQILLSVIAHGGKNEGRLLSLTEIEEIYQEEHLTDKREHIQGPLHSLLQQELLESIVDDEHDKTSEGVRYRIAIGLLRIWLNSEKPLSRI